LNEQETANVANCGAQSDSPFGAGKGDSLDMSKSANPGLPEGVTKAQTAADKMACDDKKSTRMTGGWATFIILAVVFVFLQFLGVIFGMKWGFANRQSKLAFQKNGAGKFSSFRDMQNSAREIFDAAQAQLQNLQEKLMTHAGRKGIAVHCSKNFQDYLEQQRAVGYNPTKAQTPPASNSASQTVATSLPKHEEPIDLDAELVKVKEALEKKRKLEELARMQKELAQ
jgi:hypothetical protein